MKIGNIFSKIPESIPEELIEKIIETPNCTIERIISKGHSTPHGYWYDQEKDEWVILLKGNAGLLFEGTDKLLVLKPGDYIHIPAHKKHRVEWTDPDQETIWIAIHY